MISQSRMYRLNSNSELLVRETLSHYNHTEVMIPWK